MTRGTTQEGVELQPMARDRSPQVDSLVAEKGVSLYPSEMVDKRTVSSISAVSCNIPEGSAFSTEIAAAVGIYIYGGNALVLKTQFPHPSPAFDLASL